MRIINLISLVLLVSCGFPNTDLETPFEEPPYLGKPKTENEKLGPPMGYIDSRVNDEPVDVQHMTGKHYDPDACYFGVTEVMHVSRHCEINSAKKGEDNFDLINCVSFNDVPNSVTFVDLTCYYRKHTCHETLERNQNDPSFKSSTRTVLDCQEVK